MTSYKGFYQFIGRVHKYEVERFSTRLAAGLTAIVLLTYFGEFQAAYITSQPPDAQEAWRSNYMDTGCKVET